MSCRFFHSVNLFSKKTHAAVVGCLAYPTNQPNVVFTPAQIEEGTLTNNNCATACSKLEFNFSSSIEGKSCLCSADHGSVAPNSAGDCSSSCPGDNTQMCGGKDTLMTINLNTGWYYGCYEDDGFLSLESVSPYMTPDRCISSCRNAGYSVAGTKRGEECYCASKVSDGLKISEGCNIRCRGAGFVFCGGEEALGVWIRF